jgi:hypothetical protein
VIDEEIRRLIREGLRDELASQLAPIRAAIEALAKSGGAIGDVDLAAAAPHFNRSVATLRRMAKAGTLPGSYRLGRSWRVRLGTTADEIGDLARGARHGG